MRDANFVASTSAALTETVLYPTTVSIASDASSALIGSKVTLSASVGSSYGAPTGNVIFLDGSSVLGQAALTGGAATFSSSTFLPGKPQYRAVLPEGQHIRHGKQFCDESNNNRFFHRSNEFIFNSCWWVGDVYAPGVTLISIRRIS